MRAHPAGARSHPLHRFPRRLPDGPGPLPRRGAARRPPAALGPRQAVPRPAPGRPRSNLSHAGDLAAAAVSRRRAVAAGESFSRFWARKEACVKAVGATFVDGLRLPVMREGPLRCEDGSLRGRSWWLRDGRAPAPYRAALALRGDAPFAVRVHGFLDLRLPV